METFLSFIIITVLVVYLAGIIGKWLLRRWIARKQREFAEKFGSQAGGFGQFYSWGAGQGARGQSTGSGTRSGQEGEIRVQRTAAQEKKASKQVGDYVDYVEEVED